VNCCNPDCSGVSKHLRCGKCRRYKIYLCAGGCGTQVSSHFKTWCTDCYKFTYNRYQKANQAIYRENNRDKLRENQKNIRAKRRLEIGNLL